MNSILIAINVFRRLTKEISALGFIFLFPVLAAVLAALMVSGTKTIDIGVANLSDNDYGLVSFIDANHDYTVQLMKEEAIEKAVKKKTIKFGIILPDKIEGTGSIKLIGIKDGEDIRRLRGTIDAYLGAAMTGEPLPQNESLPVNESSKEQSRAALGMIAMFIIMFIGTGMQLLIEDKRLKTFMRTFCAPLREYEMVLGHLLANLFLGMIQISVFLAVSAAIFRFDFGTSLLNVFLLLIIFLTTALGLGIGIVGLISDLDKYNMVLTITAVISSFIGGCFFPIEYMNDIFKRISNLTPQKWLMDAFSKLSSGAGLMEIRLELMIILLFGLVLFTFGVKSLKPTPEDM